MRQVSPCHRCYHTIAKPRLIMTLHLRPKIQMECLRSNGKTPVFPTIIYQYSVIPNSRIHKFRVVKIFNRKCL